MTFAAWLVAIGLPAPARTVAQQVVPELPAWQALAANRDRFLARLAGHPQLALRVFAQLMYGAQAHYATTAAWVADGRDVALWAADYGAKHGGAVGVTENDWLWLTLVHQVVRLGRLQFQPWLTPAALGPLPAHSQALQVHIPADGPLLPPLVAAAFAEARGRFGALPLLCDSWLLSPALRELLPATSNIRQFQARFTIVATRPESHQAEERLFGQWLPDPRDYEAKTSLQRRAQAWLLAGQRIGMAVGVILP